jgi:hemerythrin-like domain-containing protein
MTILMRLYDLHDNLENILGMLTESFDVVDELTEAIDRRTIEETRTYLRELLRDIEAEAESAYSTLGLVEE